MCSRDHCRYECVIIVAVVLRLCWIHSSTVDCLRIVLRYAKNLSCRHRRGVDRRSQFVVTVVILFSIQLHYTNIKY